jgi:phosphoribosyl 1,2-cyclic phosphodiesterase
MIEVFMLASGSSGNAICISTGNTRILIDAGLSGKKIAAALNEVGISPLMLDGLLVSHDHNDHISGAGIMSRRYGIPVYSTFLTWEAMDCRLGALPAGGRRIMPREGRFTFEDLTVETFPIPHDAADPVGFLFSDGRNVIALVTDLGYVTPTIAQKLAKAHCLILEANHDEKMLIKGTYPWPLKKRVLSDNGHLSNIAAAQSLAKVITPDTRHVVLAHLSEQNNIPSLAMETVCLELEEKGLCPGKKVTVQVAQRHRPSCHIRLA